MVKKILVIGGGQAAASFLTKYRSLDQNAELTLVGDEAVAPYQRPPLSKKYATGDMTAEQLLLRPDEWYEQNNVRCLKDTSVTKVDGSAKMATLSDGTSLDWDQLVLTTGSRARRLPAGIGGDLDGIHVLRSLADADVLSSELVEGKRVAIIGGGYIGLEAAAVCASRGLSVTLVEAADRILQRVACEQTSDWFRHLHERKGVTIHEGICLDRFEGDDGKIVKAVLSNGIEIDVDFVLVGIGIIPNAELAADAGLLVETGIVVNENCQTSNPDIYAAGDCAAFQYKGELTRLESVQNAIDQAECAAKNIAGEAIEYSPYPWFWSDQYDVKLQIAGLNRGYDKIVVRPGEREGGIAHFYFKGDEFLAVDAINDPRTYMVCKKLLETGKTITPEQAADRELQLKSLMQN
ncbi:MAG: FAD-dependent oxidoreductase [Rhizobiaceae bacterium]|nr:FAD-dependent oxidoreductase [Rhizobiaceae bacterium]